LVWNEHEMVGYENGMVLIWDKKFYMHGLNRMSWVWIWYEIWNDSWVRSDEFWHGIGIRYDSILVDLGMMSCYWFSMEYEWGMVIKVGMRLICVINITLLIGYVWSVLVRNSMSL